MAAHLREENGEGRQQMAVPGRLLRISRSLGSLVRRKGVEEPWVNGQARLKEGFSLIRKSKNDRSMWSWVNITYHQIDG